MSAQNDGLFECPKQDGTKVEGNTIGALPSNEAVCELVKLLRKLRSCSALICIIWRFIYRASRIERPALPPLWLQGVEILVR